MRQDDSTVRKAEMPSVIQADRARAWPYRPACYAPDDRERWMDGCYDRAATVIRAFARHRLQALESSPADGDGGVDDWAWFSGQHRLELTHYSPVYGDDDDQSVEWRVHRQGGSINDREWDLVGRGETALEAVQSARKALTPTETGEQLFRARGKSPPDDADVTERLIAAVDAWIEDPDSNAEQEIMDARAALRGLGGAEG